MKILFLAMALSNCSSMMNYQYYTLNSKSYDGTLFARKEKDDKPLSVCRPTALNKAPCIVMELHEFERMLTDAATMLKRLEDCEKKSK